MHIMSDGIENRDALTQEDHQVAYVFDLEDEDVAQQERPTKRRKISKQTKRKSDATEIAPLFVPLLNGTEKLECARLRQRLFAESWAVVDERIQGILRDANSATLDQVSSFVAAAKSTCMDQIPAAFIITGPNIASQDLLFEQLSETLQRLSASRIVRLRSSEAMTLKAALKRTIRDATASKDVAVDVVDDEDEGVRVDSGLEGRRYLDYDLEALEASLGTQACEHVFVAFQDSEGFDSGLISDLIALFHSWRPRIPFTLLFGIATSVELLQARLLKSACRLLYGGQFDCVQTGTILETVFRGAVAACDVPLRLGAPLLRSMLDRQHDHIAGIQAFISSLKYAYMCHFYANPLSLTIYPDAWKGDLVQPQLIESLRNVPSFRSHVEAAVELGDESSLAHAKSLIEDDDYLLAKVRDGGKERQRWFGSALRFLLILEAAGAQHGAFSRAYVSVMAKGVQISEQSEIVGCIRRMGAEELAAFIARVASLLREGEASLHLDASEEEGDIELQAALESRLVGLETLRATAEREGFALRSKYNGQSKVMRTTVIAQRVQLSQDSAALRDEDKKLTEIVDEVTEMLATHFSRPHASDVLFSESWLYDSRTVGREVFVPRPRAVFERCLGRPHDYLACTCCKADEGGLQPTLPATSILYQLYLETGSLINASDLWSAFHALVSGRKADDDGEDGDEGRTLVAFYRGLAELRALGFVRASRKKVDHMAKVRWL
ncbi:hypothetical protein RJ55_00479 [Drechmeria coniospora]|nr:hypothetical protein RJ55_00479 [Drechmeria coniospora]